MSENRLGSTGLWQGQMVSFCEQGTEPLDSVKKKKTGNLLTGC